MLSQRLMILASILLSQVDLLLATKPPAYCARKSTSNSSRSNNSFLWRIKRRPPSYFFGTIHVPYTDVWDYVNRNAKLAFHKADTVFLELNLNNPKTVQTLLRCQYLPAGEELVDHLPPDLFVRLRRHMDFVRQALPRWISVDQYHSPEAYAEQLFQSMTGNWQRKRPIWIMFLLNSLNPQSVESRGIPVLDLYLAQQASMLSKPLGAIETPHEQCQPLNSLRQRQVIFALNQTLRAHEKLHEAAYNAESKYDPPVLEVMRRTHHLVQHYICGSLDETVFAHDSVQLAQAHIFGNDTSRMVGEKEQEASDSINAYFRQELIQKRNVRMAKRVLFLLQKHPNKSFFFAFGAGHFLGKGSVIDLVSESGYDVRPVLARRSNNGRAGGKVSKIQGAPSGLSERKWKGGAQPSGRNGMNNAALYAASRKENEKSTYAKASSPSSSSTGESARRFQELWVRVNGHSPAPWQKIHASMSTSQNLNNYFLVQYHNLLSHNSAAPPVQRTPLLLPFSSLALIITAFYRIV